VHLVALNLTLQMYKERSRSNRIRRGQGSEHPFYKDDMYPCWRQARNNQSNLSLVILSSQPVSTQSLVAPSGYLLHGSYPLVDLGSQHQQWQATMQSEQAVPRNLVKNNSETRICH
jgi:hypothetical protein